MVTTSEDGFKGQGKNKSSHWNMPKTWRFAIHCLGQRRFYDYVIVMEFNVTWNQQKMQFGKPFGKGTKKYKILPEFVNWILKSPLQNRVADRLLSITMWWRVYGKR